MSILSNDLQTLERTFSHRPLARQAEVRIGLVQLATDYVLENDWHQIVGDRVELYSTRMPFSSEIDSAKLRGMQDDIGASAALVAPGLDLDVLVYGCTAASMLIGDEQVARQLTLQRPGVPTTNPWLAARTALRALGAGRIAVLTPYTSEVNAALLNALQQEGFKVAALGGFQLTRDTEIPAVHPDSIEAALSELLSELSVDAVFLSCTNLRAMQMLDRLETRFSIPMVSSNQAMLWHALRLSGSQLRFTGFGQLLGQH